jgi:hypothetical protein
MSAYDRFQPPGHAYSDVNDKDAQFAWNKAYNDFLDDFDYFESFSDQETRIALAEQFANENWYTYMEDL